MPLVARVARRVPLGRAVAASDVPALRAAPQVEPPAAGREALGAALARGRHVGIDRRGLVGHASEPSPVAPRAGSPRAPPCGVACGTPGTTSVVAPRLGPPRTGHRTSTTEVCAVDSFWDLFWWFFWIYVWVALLMILFSIVVDIFRDHSLNGWGKALWIVFLVFFPFLAILVYMIARGRGMAQRSTGRRRRSAPRRTSTSATSPARARRRRMRSPRRRRCSTPARSARASSTPSRPRRSRA